MQTIEQALEKLQRSDFRAKFHLSARERAYAEEKGMDVIRKHAAQFVAERLAPAEPLHDGKQTPMRGHPVFIAQHATATCCRGCIYKWHKMRPGKELSKVQQEYLVDVIMTWIEGEMKR